MDMYVSKDGNTFIHDKTDEEYVIERIKQRMYEILSKSSLSDFQSDLQELLKLQSGIDYLQAIVNYKKGIAFQNAFGGNSYSEEHLQTMNGIYEEFMHDRKGIMK